MIEPLDMKDTIGFYNSISPEARKNIDMLLLSTGWNKEKFLQTGHYIADHAKHFALTEEEVYGLLNAFPENARQRALISGIYGLPAMWFEKRDDKQRIRLFGLRSSVENGYFDDYTAGIIHAEGLAHEYMHCINALGRMRKCCDN